MYKNKCDNLSSYATKDAEFTNEIQNTIERSKYAEKIFNNLCAVGKGRTFGAQVCAFVADHPDEAEALAEHHCQSFLAKKQQYMRPQTVNKFIIHNRVRAAVAGDNIKEAD